MERIQRLCGSIREIVLLGWSRLKSVVSVRICVECEKWYDEKGDVWRSESLKPSKAIEILDTCELCKLTVKELIGE